MSTTEVHLPGRLGDPNMTIGTDPRADPRMVAVLAAMGLDGHGAPSPISDASAPDDLHAWVNEAEPGFEMLFDTLFADQTPPDGVVSSTEVIRGVDDNDVTLFIHRPADASGPLPCVYHIHGGGMVLLSATGLSYVAWRNELASRGLVAVGVEFRNGGGKLGNHPFPAGLNDCAAGLQWVAANKAALGVSTITVSGESGGGNLALATTLKAKRDGYLDIIDGVFAQCPYISRAYAKPPAGLPSLTENDQYFLGCENMSGIAKLYDLGGSDATNPLAWPLHATVEDLTDLPPHVISVNELDPLRDEGLAYFHKLLAAGNSAQARTVNGTCHAGDVIFRAAMPEVYAASAAALADFARSL